MFVVVVVLVFRQTGNTIVGHILTFFAVLDFFRRVNLNQVMNGSALTTLADSATADYELQNDFCGLTTLPQVLYPQVREVCTATDPRFVKNKRAICLSTSLYVCGSNYSILCTQT